MMRRLNSFVLGFIVLFILLFPYEGIYGENHFTRYTVKKGDIIYEISKSFRISINELKTMNKLNNDNIKPGQILIIPRRKIEEKVVTKSQKDQVQIEYYDVMRGDNLFKISKKVGLSVEEIKRLNNLTSERLKLGQRLLLKKR